MFKDVPPSHWAFRAIAQVAEWGLLKGYPDGTFGPDRPVTRAELAAILTRLLDADPENRVILQRMPSLVYIVSRKDAQTGGVGSGCWIAPWRVLTNAHVVSFKSTPDAEPVLAERVEVWGYPGGGFSPLDPMPARVAVIKHELDLALLEVTPPDYRVEPKPVVLADQEPDVGDWVLAVGNPFGLPWDVTRGTVRHKARWIRYWTHTQRLYATDAPINPGNSGGILLDLRGRMVGVPCAGIPGAVYTFAIPLPEVKRFLKEAGVQA